MLARRTVLGLLGLAPATAAIPSTEDIGTSYGHAVPKLVEPSVELQVSVATALERMAAGIRRCELEAIEIEVHSVGKVNTFLEHELRVRFCLKE